MSKKFYLPLRFTLFLSTPLLASTNVENKDSAKPVVTSDLLADADIDVSDLEAEAAASDSMEPNKEPASEVPPLTTDDVAGGDDSDILWGSDE